MITVEFLETVLHEQNLVGITDCPSDEYRTEAEMIVGSLEGIMLDETIVRNIVSKVFYAQFGESYDPGVVSEKLDVVVLRIIETLHF